MSRHIADRRSPAGTTKARAFYDLARQQGELHPVAQVLLKKPRPPVAGARLKEYLRIERGHRA